MHHRYMRAESDLESGGKYRFCSEADLGRVRDAMKRLKTSVPRGLRSFLIRIVLGQR